MQGICGMALHNLFQYESTGARLQKKGAGFTKSIVLGISQLEISHYSSSSI